MSKNAKIKKFRKITADNETKNRIFQRNFFMMFQIERCYEFFFGLILRLKLKKQLKK